MKTYDPKTVDAPEERDDIEFDLSEDEEDFTRSNQQNVLETDFLDDLIKDEIEF